MNATLKKENRQAATVQNQEQRVFGSPRVNILETKEGYILEAEMPGVNKQGLEVLLEGNTLTLIGRRTEENPLPQWVYRESSGRDYRRVFELDPTIDSSRIDAMMEQGVLKLFLPKAEQVKPRKIAVS